MVLSKVSGGITSNRYIGTYVYNKNAKNALGQRTRAHDNNYARLYVILCCSFYRNRDKNTKQSTHVNKEQVLHVQIP